MLEPKTFYRELDATLSLISKEKSDKDFFIKILNELENKFAETLNILDSHVYEQRGDEFVFVKTSARRQDSRIARKIPFQAEGIQYVLKNGVVVFDQPVLYNDFDMNLDHSRITPAAILVQNPVRRWLLVFELKEGWVSEEITLFLNAMRTAINYRLFSEMMESDLRQAEQIQQSLLPEEPLRIQGFDMCGHSQSAVVVGGDFYDYFQFDESDFGFFIGDASGHGIPAALLVRDVVIGLRMGLAKEMRLVTTLEKLNQVIQRSTYSTNFVSLFLGEIESDGHLFYVNAGHPSPLLIAGDTVQELGSTGVTLGFLPKIELRRSYVRMVRDSMLVLFSDGIVERERSEDEQFGVDRLKETVMQHRRKSAEEIVKRVFRSVYEFGNRTVWDDDATLVIVKKICD